MAEAKVAVIGGTGLYQIEGLTEIEEVEVATPFGTPSDSIIIGTLEGVRVAFLPRHGKGHRISPTEVNARANIFALKLLGVEYVISVSAVGSMREDYAPLDVAIPNQLFDHTKSRPRSFFEDGVVAHIAFAEPFCPRLSELLFEAAKASSAKVHSNATYLCIEGPAFSTRAESRIYRQWGVDIIGMTAVPEARLAREAEMCYATLAMVTDYDVWHESEEQVTVEMIIFNLLRNVEVAKGIIRGVVPHIPAVRDCSCQSALQNAVVTDWDLVPSKTRERLLPLVRKYVES